MVRYQENDPLGRIVGKPEKCPRKPAMQLEKCRELAIRCDVGDSVLYHSQLGLASGEGFGGPHPKSRQIVKVDLVNTAPLQTSYSRTRTFAKLLLFQKCFLSRNCLCPQTDIMFASWTESRRRRGFNPLNTKRNEAWTQTCTITVEPLCVRYFPVGPI